MKEQIEQYKELLENISIARQINETLAKKLITEFCNRLEGQLTLLHEIQQDREAARAIHNKLEIIGESLTKRAQGFYQKLPDSLEFKIFLIRCHEETNFAFLNNQVARACRNAFRQIETLVNYITNHSNLVERLLDNQNEWSKYKLDIDTRIPRRIIHQEVTKKLSLVNKIWLINNQFLPFFKAHPDCKYSLVKTYNTDKYNACYRLRNADSHGWNFKTLANNQEYELAKIETDFDNYLRELMKIIVPLRDLIPNLKIEDIYISPANQTN
ncbi:hypothetical protein [Hymenobacter rubripertinctus]|uniref:hypothetical protein n=1 Tax=Hymenobacter rubripertinctus TaxID=2029981 RepID=UPI0011C3F651|nr:hypothetical protein [Hymenobacter rubripertinctus]